MKVRARPSSQELSRLAALIAGAAPPLWLGRFLSEWSSSLFLDRGIFEIQPTKSHVVEALKEMLADIRRPNASALNILEGVASVELLTFLKHEERRRDSETKGLSVTLSDLDVWVTDALQSKELAGKNGTVRKGRGRAMPPGGLAPKDYCAVIVTEAWSFCRGRWPNPRNPKAWEAAEMLWRLTGGEAHSVGEDPYASWRYHFARAQEAPGISGLRSEIRRHLHEHESQQKLLAEMSVSPPHSSAQESA